MTFDEIREYCLSLPATTEDMAFGEDYLLIRVCGRIFSCIELKPPHRIVFKSDPERAIELRERYSDIEPAWHWNKKYWIQFDGSASLTRDLIRSMARHSYSEVVKKLPRKIKEDCPDITTVS